MMTIKWFGTATILIDINGEKLLFDPFFRLNKKLEKPSLDVFSNVDYIFNTHAHVDHICDMPIILNNSKACLYGTQQAVNCLMNDGVDTSKLKVLNYNDVLETKNAKIIVHKSEHIKFNFTLVLRTVFRALFKFQVAKAIKLLKLHKKYNMKGEIIAFEINADNKKIFLMGSAGEMKDYKFPENIDVLIWPFQGRSNMTKYSLPIIERIKPKTIILDHFDNAYPPITKLIKTDKFIKALKTKHPDIEVIEPKFAQEIQI